MKHFLQPHSYTVACISAWTRPVTFRSVFDWRWLLVPLIINSEIACHQIWYTCSELDGFSMRKVKQIQFFFSPYFCYDYLEFTCNQCRSIWIKNEMTFCQSFRWDIPMFVDIYILCVCICIGSFYSFDTFMLWKLTIVRVRRSVSSEWKREWYFFNKLRHKNCLQR